MAGHSKWSNIKRRKGKEDARRAREFTKIAREIAVATRLGGPDPEFNPQLLQAIDKAKAANMPKDNIERAISKGSGELSGKNFEEVIYEGYGPHGIAILVVTLTDNRNRTAGEVRHAFDKNHGNLGQDGSVSYLFKKRGFIGIEKSEEIDEDELMMEALELGAEDFIEEEEGYEILTSVPDFNTVKDGLEEAGYEFVICELSYLPDAQIELEENEQEEVEKIIEALEDLDDTQEVYHNLDI